MYVFKNVIYIHLDCNPEESTASCHCHNEDGRIQLRKESLLQEVIHSEKLNGAFRRAEAELP